MPQEKQAVEARGHDVQAAIKAGLTMLGLTRDDVIVEVLDEGSRGLLGIGSRDAVVRVIPLAVSSPPAVETPLVKETVERAQVADTPTSSLEEEEELDEETEEVVEGVVTEGEEAKAAVETLQELLDKMQVSATVTARLAEPDDLTGRRIQVLEVSGADLGVLIGPRGETLNALQYISRLMVGHRLRQRADFVVDVEGYRQRREQALSRLAERMAKKVVKERRAISLEPMPPNERRIIHMTLRDYENVYTQSTGEGKRRKVRIFPK